MKLKGNVHRNPWGDLTLRLSDEEGKLLAESVPASALNERKLGLTEDQCEIFFETWGEELESMGSEAAIAALGRLSLLRMRGFLRVADIPEHCLDAIESFSVEDSEDVEDLELSHAAALLSRAPCQAPDVNLNNKQNSTFWDWGEGPSGKR